jgi:hypothetical protein
MNKKIISLAAIVVVFALGFLYLNQSYLVAGGKDGKECIGKTGCDKDGKKDGKTEKQSGIKAGGEFSSYEFTTDQACCDGMKADLENDIKGIAGVKEIKFGSTCNVSKMTNVTVYYAAGETSEENIVSVVKGKNYDCSGETSGSKSCDKEGMKSGSKKEGCDPSKECPSGKQKSKESKQL